MGPKNYNLKLFKHINYLTSFILNQWEGAEFNFKWIWSSLESNARFFKNNTTKKCLFWGSYFQGCPLRILVIGLAKATKCCLHSKSFQIIFNESVVLFVLWHQIVWITRLLTHWTIFKEKFNVIIWTSDLIGIKLLLIACELRKFHIVVKNSTKFKRI